jgi:aspartyl-tRNA(Asn)/glutamyl-tRNA(Gln) amidotransferase subunit B
VISVPIAKQVTLELLTDVMSTRQPRRTVTAIVDEHGWRQNSDNESLERLCEQVLAQNERQVAEYRQNLAVKPARAERAVRFFVGQVLKLSQGKANPRLVNDILLRRLNDASTETTTIK